MTKKIKFKLSLTNNSILDPAQKLDKKTVLFFYPKAMTGGCSIEVQDFQKNYQPLKNLVLMFLVHQKTQLKKILNFLISINLNMSLGQI